MSIGVAVRITRNELTVLVEALGKIADDNPDHEDTPRILAARAKFVRALTKVEGKLARKFPPP